MEKGEKVVFQDKQDETINNVMKEQSKIISIKMSKTNRFSLVPLMLCFFAMGFVDLVGIASNYVKEDLGLSDSVANMLP